MYQVKRVVIRSNHRKYGQSPRVFQPECQDIMPSELLTCLGLVTLLAVDDLDRARASD